MKGIYLTQEAKQEIEAKIVELEKSIKDPKDEIMRDYFQGQESLLKEILSSATILPEETSWNEIQPIETQEWGTVIRMNYLMANYPQGVIIKPKE